MNDDSRQELLQIARGALIACTTTQSRERSPTRNSYPRDCGAFVTLHGPDNRLRGCIGCLSASQPLPEVITDMAQSAALRDTRFEPVRAEEVAGLSIEISVLSAKQAVRSLDEIEIGRDGLLVIAPHSRGVLLPQVASERDWDSKTFVEQTCVKANLSKQAYLEDDVELYRFSAEVFNEQTL